MLRDIIKKEVLDTITSPKFIFTFLLCTVLILLSVYTGINSYRAELSEYNASLALNKNNLEGAPNYQALAGLGIKISKPPQVLSTIIAGIQAAVGRMATVNVAYDPDLVGSRYDTTPVFAVFGELDLTFVVKIVLSLLAILFTFDAIVGEKERGTLKLSLANRLPRHRLILGKAIGGFLSLLLPLVIPLVVALIMLTLYPDISLSGGDWLRIGLIFVLYMLYISVFFTLGLFISSRTSSSSISLLVLLFIWVTFVTIIPRAAVMVSGQIYPIPSVYEVTAQKDAFLQEIQGSVPKRLSEWQKENSPENTDQYREKFRKFLEDLQQELTSKIDKKNAAVEEEYQAKRRMQQALATNLSRVSPTSTLMFGAMTLGRTGIQEHERFLNSIKTYKPVFTTWVNARMMKSLNLRGGEQPKPDISDMPVHEFKSETLGQSVHSTMVDFTIMLLLVILFFTGAFVSFLRYDVR